MPELSATPRRARRRTAGALVALLALLSIAAVLIPLWTIRPFEAQTPAGIELSYLLRRWAPAGTLAAVAAGLALTAWLWRGARWWSRAALVLAVALTASAAWAARQNVFERMFAPPGAVRHAAAAEAGWVDGSEMVLAVEIGGDAVAYPVRQLAYHHLVEDVVGGVPIVATY